MRLIKITLVLLSVTILMQKVLYSETIEQSIGINPVGVLYQGLSYLEYERKIRPNASLTCRIDNFRYDYSESETSYTYDEEGNGYGVGIGIRHYFYADDDIQGFYGGTGIDLVSVDWNWNEYDYGSTYQGEGTTMSYAFHANIGYKFMLDEQFFLSPSLYTGWIYISNENLAGFGLFISPAVTIGSKI